MISIHRPNDSANFVKKFPSRIVEEVARRIEQFVGASDVGLRLLHCGNIKEDEHLPQMMICAERGRALRETR